MRKIAILLVEDCISDQKLFDLALENSAGIHLEIKANGGEALHFLRIKEEHINRSRPDLVVLDLRLPVMSGCEILRKIRENPRLKQLPVAVFTGTHPPKRLLDICRHNADFYIIKPDGIDEYFGIVTALVAYCRNVIKFPGQNSKNTEECRRNLLVA